MDDLSAPRLDVRNTAAIDLAVELLGLALRDERGPDHAEAALLRTRLSGSGSTRALRDRVLPH